MVLVILRISELPMDLRERLETCNWKIEEFYNYIPTEIKIDKIDREYIRRSKIKKIQIITPKNQSFSSFKIN